MILEFACNFVVSVRPLPAMAAVLGPVICHTQMVQCLYANTHGG